MAALLTDSRHWKYRAMLGVGGIGSGMFFALNHNHTLGREESRSGHFLDQKDYCKLHIISHYVQALLGPEFCCLPVGMVGQDEVGTRLIAEMAEIGLDTRWVSRCAGAQTLFSFCFLYPDGTGGNLTSDDSACERVDAAYVARTEVDFLRFENAGVALAVPEVPLPAREKILELGTDHHFLRVASFSSEEIGQAVTRGMVQQCDWLAMNVDEAAAAAGLQPDQPGVEGLVRAAVERLTRLNPCLRLSITAGKAGSWVWDGQRLDHQPALDMPVVSTAGAGDAHLAGILVGMIAGLGVPACHEMGCLVAALSVTSPHTLDKRIGKDALCDFMQNKPHPISKAIQGLLSPEGS
jgi:ribokinase